MFLTNSESIQGKEVKEYLGVVYGSTVRARHVGNDILASFRNLVGGEIDEYTKLFAQSREQAMDRMVENAKSKGANAIISIRFETSQIAQGCSEVMVYGTAVKI